MTEAETEAQREGTGMQSEGNCQGTGGDSPCSPNYRSMTLCQTSQCKELFSSFCYNKSKNDMSWWLTPD